MCLYNYADASEIVCDTSAADGTYEVPAPYGLQVYVKVSLKGHSNFKRSWHSVGDGPGTRITMFAC